MLDVSDELELFGNKELIPVIKIVLELSSTYYIGMTKNSCYKPK